MSGSVALCTHIKTDGVRCGSPAVSGTLLCYHHSAVKTALGKRQAMNEYGTCPLPFVFPEDRASMQINFFLLLGALNEGRIDLPTYRCFLSLLREMARNLGKTGSLVEEEVSDQRSAISDRQDSEKVAGGQAQKRQAASESNGKSLNTASAKLQPEACFLNSVSAGAGVDPFGLGWMGEREARRTSGGRGKEARRVA